MWSSQMLKKRRTRELASPSSLCHTEAQHSEILDLSLANPMTISRLYTLLYTDGYTCIKKGSVQVCGIDE